MPVVLSRRELLASTMVAGSLLILPAAPTMLARKQTDMASLDLPPLDITVTADAFEGLPESIEAGRYLLNVTATEDVEGGGIVAFLQPYEMTPDELFAFLGSLDESDPLPAVVYQSKFAGGASAMSGATGSAVIDLTPGEWVVWGDDPSAPQAPGVLTVTGEFPEAPTEIASDISFTLIEFDIMVEGNLTAGEHTIMIDNQGAQPHFLDLSMVPPGTTNDDVTALFNGFMTGTPVASPLAEEEAETLLFTPTQSIDVQAWINVTLEAGTYLAACWFPTAGLVDDPHAFHGMHTVFDVT